MEALGESRFSSCSFLTSALDGGEWSASRAGRALPPGKGPPVPTVQEGWDPEPVWTQSLEEKSSVGDRTPIIQSVVRHYAAWATSAPKGTVVVMKYYNLKRHYDTKYVSKCN
jgi:hypothetical protein